VYIGIHFPTLRMNLLPSSSGGSRFIRNVSQSSDCCCLVCNIRNGVAAVPLVQLCLQSVHTQHYYNPVERLLVESVVISCDVRILSCAATAQRVAVYRDVISVASCEVVPL
jgi:hypothetical protein